MKSGIKLITEERRRQVESEGWSRAHDDSHGNGELVEAAVCYAVGNSDRWPWDKYWWKPSGRVRDLVKAGALIAAEIDRLQRAEEAK